MKGLLRNSRFWIVAFGLFEFFYVQVILILFKPQVAEIHAGIIQNGNNFLWTALWIYIALVGAFFFVLFSNKWVIKQFALLLQNNNVIYGFFALLVIVILLFGHPAYGANDDYAMMTIASGQIDGIPDIHLVFSNVILGSILKIFYDMTASVNWYSCYLFLTFLFSSFTLLATILDFMKNHTAKYISIAVLLIFTQRFIYTINFTTDAILACFAGVSLLILTLSTPDVQFKPFRVFWGVGLIFLSGLIRIESLELVFVLTAPLLFYLIFKSRVKWLFYSLAIALTLSAGAFLLNQLSYINNSEWGPYNVYNQQRGAISGTPKTSVDTSTDLLWDAIGWRKTGFDLFSDWYFIDNQVFTVESFQTVNSIYATKLNDSQVVISTFEDLFQNNHLEIITFLVMIIYAIGFSNRLTLVGIMRSICLLIYSFGVIIIITVAQRMPVYLFLPSLLILSIEIVGINVFASSFASSSHARAKTSYAMDPFFISILLVLLLVQASVMVKEDQVNYRQQQVITQLIDNVALKLGGTDNPLVVIQAAAVPIEWTSPLSSGAIPFNHVLTGWLINSPPYNHVLQHYGIANLIDAVYSRPNVYLLGLADQAIRAYLQDHRDVTTVEREKDRFELPNGTKFDWVNLVRLEKEQNSN